MILSPMVLNTPTVLNTHYTGWLKGLCKQTVSRNSGGKEMSELNRSLSSDMIPNSSAICENNGYLAELYVTIFKILRYLSFIDAWVKHQAQKRYQ